MARLLATFEQAQAPFKQKYFVSEDNGLTWTEHSTNSTNGNIFLSGKVLGRTSDFLITTNSVGSATGDAYAGITKTDGTSGTFTSSYTVSGSGDYWLMDNFARLSSTVILGLGFIQRNSTNLYTTLRSIDNGDSFMADSSLQDSIGDVLEGLSADSFGPNVVVLGYPDLGVDPVQVFRSTNNGSSWSAVTMPTASYTVGNGFQIWSVRSLGGGVGLAGGTAFHDITGKGTRLWRTTDSGASWTEVTTGISSLGPFTNGSGIVEDIVNLGNNHVVLAMENSTVAKPFRLSNDNGLTFAIEGTYASSVPSDFQPNQMVEASDGSIICVGRRLTLQTGQIWRGVPNASFSDITWTLIQSIAADVGTDCAAMGVGILTETGPGSVLLGVSHDCGHAFAPNPCPQECADIPASRGIVGTSFLDAVPSTNAGFNAGLFLLGLGNAGTARATVALGRLSTCGHGFMANASDQFCGVN